MPRLRALRMDDELGHRRVVVRRRCEIEVADDGVTVECQQVPGAVVRKVAQHLVADGGDAVRLPWLRRSTP